MKKWFYSLNNCYKVSFISEAIVLACSLLTIWLFLYNLIEVPLGIILGGTIGALSYFFFGLVEQKTSKDKKGFALTILIIVLKFLLLAIALVVSAILYYYLKIKLFNVFAVAGSYLVSSVVYTIFNLKKGKENEHLC